MLTTENILEIFNTFTTTTEYHPRGEEFTVLPAFPYWVDGFLNTENGGEVFTVQTHTHLQAARPRWLDSFGQVAGRNSVVAVCTSQTDRC